MDLLARLRTLDGDLTLEQCILHLATRHGASDPLALYRNGEFDEWQSYQRKRNFSRKWVWLFCIDDFLAILRAFLRGRVPSGAIFGGAAPSHPRPHACSGDLPRREPPHGGLSPPPAPSGHSRGVLIACRGKEDEAVSGRGDDAGLETQVRRAGGAARRRPHRARRFGIGCGGRRGRRHFRRRQGFSGFARSRADEPERPRAGAEPAAPGVGRQPPASVPGPAQPRAGRRSGRHRCRERRAVRARRRGIDLRRGAGRAPGRHAVRHWPADAGRYRVAGTAAQAVITVFDRIHGKAVREAAAVFGHGSRPSRRAAGRCDSGGGIRSGVFMQRQDLRAASRAVSVYPPVRDAQQRLRAR